MNLAINILNSETCLRLRVRVRGSSLVIVMLRVTLTLHKGS